LLNPRIRPRKSVAQAKRLLALSLTVLLITTPAVAGIAVTGSNGITATGADGVQFVGLSGITATGADGLVTFGPNGITATGADGITATGADGITATGADGYTYTGANGITATGADSLQIANANGITATGADGITATGADGTTYSVDSIHFYFPSGITATGADGITATGADGITATGADSRQIARCDGITATGADGVTISGADGITATGADGQTVKIPTGNVTLVGADLMIVAGAEGISFTGADSIRDTGIAALNAALAPTSTVGLQSIDPELAITLNNMTDDSNINAVVVYHNLPTDSDLAQLNGIGVVGGLRFRTLPMVTISTTRDQLIAISRFASVRSIYGNRTLTPTSEPEVRAITGVDRAWNDADIKTRNASLPVTGRNVTVAVLDTGIDSTHRDLAGRVTRNVKFADTLSASVGFTYPTASPNLSNTDLVEGHGSFVAGVIGGSGAASNGKFSGVAPGANLVGLSAGELTLLYVLEGLDYLLTNRSELNVRVLNCSFSANVVFDTNDPVNIATKMLTDEGVNVVFSAGNTGPGQHTLNPYSIAPWVIGVGATDSKGRLASFSSRGDFASALFRPTLVAPGVGVVSVRGAGIVNVTGAQGIANGDLQRLSSSELPYYTTASGTSFSAPQVAGTIALMLEANPSLTPADVRDILQATATPLAPYYQHEVGAGMLNAHAAVLQAAFPDRDIGDWRGANDLGQVGFTTDPLTTFSGVVQPGSPFETTVQVPADTIVASIQIGWGPLTSLNDLALSVYDPGGNLAVQSNTLNLPGIGGKSERISLNLPAAGVWRVKVTNGLLGTAQGFSGVLSIGRASYRTMTDIQNLNVSTQGDILQNIRSFAMSPVGAKFRPTFTVPRADLAKALVIGTRVPQYLPALPTYSDVRDNLTMSFVESAQANPDGALFVDVTAGGRFRPNDNVTRLAAAVALVRAAGLRSEAEATLAPLSFLDASTIPAELRGYVSVAVSKGFLSSGALFQPQNPVSRAELAHAIAVIENRATQ
jgi:serine protease AprX